eukprot:7409723-Lingulodinium_polyedra.AAC.1
MPGAPATQLGAASAVPARAAVADAPMEAVAQALLAAEEREQEDPLLPYPGGPTSVGPAPST